MWWMTMVICVAYSSLIQNHRHLIFIHHGINNFLGDGVEGIKILWQESGLLVVLRAGKVIVIPRPNVVKLLYVVLCKDAQFGTMMRSTTNETLQIWALSEVTLYGYSASSSAWNRRGSSQVHTTFAFCGLYGLFRSFTTLLLFGIKCRTYLQR